jgi:acyl-CoA synthetase (AMP-forming)/AMP-acid ligase II
MKRDLKTTRDLVKTNAESFPDMPFLNFYDEIVTYGDLDDRTNSFANYLLEQGLRTGDAISLMMVNSPEFFYTLLGAQKIGVVRTGCKGLYRPEARRGRHGRGDSSLLR